MSLLIIIANDKLDIIYLKFGRIYVYVQVPRWSYKE